VVFFAHSYIKKFIIFLHSIILGLIVSKDHLSTIFKYGYYFSVTSITQRALIVNDFLCCYLTTTCDDLVDLSSLSTQPFSYSNPLFNHISYSDYEHLQDFLQQHPNADSFISYINSTSSFNSSSFLNQTSSNSCPIQLKIGGVNDSQEGNLGRLALQFLGFVDFYLEK